MAPAAVRWCLGPAVQEAVLPGDGTPWNEVACGLQGLPPWEAIPGLLSFPGFVRWQESPPHQLPGAALSGVTCWPGLWGSGPGCNVGIQFCPTPSLGALHYVVWKGPQLILTQSSRKLGLHAYCLAAPRDRHAPSPAAWDKLSWHLGLMTVWFDSVFIFKKIFVSLFILILT